MTRPITPEELAILRSDGLAARLFAIIDQPVTVYQCQVDQTFTTHDKIVQVAYDNAIGTLTNVLPGMTVLVGSTPGAWDKGLARVRKTWTINTAYIGETSEIGWEDNLYLTVIDEFVIWPRHLRLTEDGSAWMDYDVEYSDQHTAFAPIPCLGPDRVLKKLSDEAVSTQLDASASWVIGSSISGYSWSVLRGSATLTNANTATPTLTATAPGRILLACTVTAANGKSSTGYRTVYVYDDNHPPTEIVLESFSGSTDRGGFEFSFSLPVSPGFVPRQLCKVVLFAEGDDIVGPVPGAENILAIGWVDDCESEVDEKGGRATLSAKGPQFWLRKVVAYSVGLESVDAPKSWLQMSSLTVDKALWHLVYWRSTLCNCSDFFVTGDERTATSLIAPLGPLWDQIRGLAGETILANPMCDPLGRLFVEIDANYLPESERASIPVIVSLTRDDYVTISISARSQEVCKIELSGVDANGMGLFAVAPGTVFGRYGNVQHIDRLLLATQEQATSLAGLIYGREGRAIDTIGIDLCYALRLITLAPRQYIHVRIETDDTPAGISYEGNVIPRAISVRAANGYLLMHVDAEPETFPGPAIAATPDASIPSEYDFDFPDIPDFSGWNNVPGAGNKFAVIIVRVENYGLWFTDEADKPNPRWWSANQGGVVAYKDFVISPSGRILAAGWNHNLYVGSLGGLRLYADAALLKELLGPPPEPYITDAAWKQIGLRGGDILASGGWIYGSWNDGYMFINNSKLGFIGSGLWSGPGYGPGRISSIGSALVITYPTGFGSAAMRRSVDGGHTWSSQYDLSFSTGSSVHRRAGATMLVHGSGGWVAKIVGDTIDYLNPTVGGTDHDVAIAPGAQRMMVGGSLIRRSSDGGSTWGATMQAGGSVQCADGDCWVAATYYDVFVSSDFGDTWMAITGNLRDFIGIRKILQVEVLGS